MTTTPRFPKETEQPTLHGQQEKRRSRAKGGNWEWATATQSLPLRGPSSSYVVFCSFFGLCHANTCDYIRGGLKPDESHLDAKGWDVSSKCLWTGQNGGSPGSSHLSVWLHFSKLDWGGTWCGVCNVKQSWAGRHIWTEETPGRTLRVSKGWGVWSCLMEAWKSPAAAAANDKIS